MTRDRFNTRASNLDDRVRLLHHEVKGYLYRGLVFELFRINVGARPLFSYS